MHRRAGLRLREPHLRRGRLRDLHRHSRRDLLRVLSGVVPSVGRRTRDQPRGRRNDSERALPLLEKAVAECFALWHPHLHTRVHHWLGQACEALHDERGACDAYAVVLKRWGRAKPRSVTAEAALTRSRALRCDR